MTDDRLLFQSCVHDVSTRGDSRSTSLAMRMKSSSTPPGGPGGKPVYIDGHLASESPVMRLGQEPWRFDVRIPERSRLINLVVSDAGSRSPLDLANWVDAGFVLRR